MPDTITTYRLADRAYTFCPGCSHTIVLDQLNAALVKLQLDPRQVVMVTDIGCVGMSDQFFNVNAFHGLHGRAVTYAIGIKLANPDLKVIALVGDGSLGIGGHHILNAARRNVGITVLVFNNFNFGMTGGQHSVTTPHGAHTSSTREGNLEYPLDICAIASVSGAAYVFRGTAFDKDLSERIAEAIQTPGFALLDLWELCTAYYVPNNNFSRTALMQTLQTLNFPTGVLQKMDRPEFAHAYRNQISNLQSHPSSAQPIETKFTSALERTTRIIIAGSAGGKVRSTASALAIGAMMSGLWATQRDDYPVSVMSGYSVSEVILSREEILYLGIEKPDIVAVLSPEGLSQVPRQLRAMDESQTVYVVPELAEHVQTRARKIVFNLTRPISKKSLALTATAAIIRHANLYPLEAFREAISIGQRAEIAQENLRAVEASAGIL
ncbi:MAG: thiamine pyrophosphate-dependent enzyme [Anaerolineae bacterium]|nr:thiamine pyrophosphate-dependent enzyme [Anaerolineae bacterium]